MYRVCVGVSVGGQRFTAQLLVQNLGFERSVRLFRIGSLQLKLEFMETASLATPLV